jgi:hypothetical protein
MKSFEGVPTPPAPESPLNGGVREVAQQLHHEAAFNEDENFRGLFNKSFQATEELLDKGSEDQKRNFLFQITEDKELAGLVPGDIVYIDDNPLKINNLDREKEELEFLNLSAPEEGKEHHPVFREPFNTFVEKQADIQDVSKIGLRETAKVEQPPVDIPQPEKVVEPPVKWKPVIEHAPEGSVERKQLQERKKWLGAAFTAHGDDPEMNVSREMIGNAMKRQWGEAFMRGATPLIDQRFANDQDMKRAIAAMDDFTKGNRSLRDVLDSAKTFKELKSLKLMSLALLDSHLSPDKKNAWNELSETQKRLTRLGEMIGLEIERRQIDLTMQGGRKMDQGVVERAYVRYRQYASGDDVPGMFVQRFNATAESLAQRYHLDGGKLWQKPERAVPEERVVESVPDQPVARETVLEREARRAQEEGPVHYTDQERMENMREAIEEIRQEKEHVAPQAATVEEDKGLNIKEDFETTMEAFDIAFAVMEKICRKSIILWPLGWLIGVGRKMAKGMFKFMFGREKLTHATRAEDIKQTKKEAASEERQKKESTGYQEADDAIAAYYKRVIPAEKSAAEKAADEAIDRYYEQEAPPEKKSRRKAA